MASRFFESGFLSVENDGQFEYILKSKYDTKTCARKVKGYLLHYLNFKSEKVHIGYIKTIFLFYF